MFGLSHECCFFLCSNSFLGKMSTLPVDQDFWEGVKPPTRLGLIAFCLNGLDVLQMMAIEVQKTGYPQEARFGKQNIEEDLQSLGQGGFFLAHGHIVITYMCKSII